MKNMRFLYLLLIIISIGLMLFLGGRFMMNAFKPEPELDTGFPETSSSARDGFLMRLSTVPQQSLISNNDDNVHLAQFISDESKIEYYIYPANLLDEVFQDATKKPAGKTKFLHLTDDLNDEIQEYQVNSEKVGLPSIEVHNHSLHIATEQKEEQFGMEELFDAGTINKGDLKNIQILFVEEDSFALAVSFRSEGSTDDVYYVFMNDDFSDIVVFHEQDYVEKITAGDLSSFEHLILDEKLNERFYVVTGSQGIYDAKENEVLFVDEQDRISVDGKYVYIRGNEEHIKKGKQRIQRTEDYFAGNHEDYATFDLPFRDVAKELDFTPISFGSHARLHYFSEDYIVYSFAYNALFFGTSGSTNTIVDLQESKDNPTFYLEDVGIRTSIN